MKFLKEPSEELEKVEAFNLIQWLGKLSVENQSVSEEIAKGIKVAWEHYTRIWEAVSEHEFLNKHLFIVRDLRILEEKLVEAGILTPEEVFDLSVS